MNVLQGHLTPGTDVRWSFSIDCVTHGIGTPSRMRENNTSSPLLRQMIVSLTAFRRLLTPPPPAKLVADPPAPPALEVPAKPRWPDEAPPAPGEPAVAKPMAATF